MRIYAIIGSSQQTIVDEAIQYTAGENEIEMHSERPSPEHIAAQDGTWVLLEPEQPTTEQKLTQLDTEYQQLVQQLQSDFFYAQMMNDIALMDDLRIELQNLNESYDRERRAIENVDDQETVYPVPEGTK